MGSRIIVAVQCSSDEIAIFSTGRITMAMHQLVEYTEASAEVRAVYDDIMATRKTDWINNFWKALANDPATLRRTWESIKQIMAPGALDPLTKEMIYIAVSVTNQCPYCIASHTASARNKGMTDAMFHELMAVVGMANETNRLASGYQSKSTSNSRSRTGFSLSGLNSAGSPVPKTKVKITQAEACATGVDARWLSIKDGCATRAVSGCPLSPAYINQQRG
jgi:AhpD family alkylhydroperoxidase